TMMPSSGTDVVLVVTASANELLLHYPPSYLALSIGQSAGYRGLEMTPSRLLSAPLDPYDLFDQIVVALPGDTQSSIYRQSCSGPMMHPTIDAQPIAIQMPMLYRIARQ